jgi:hypothetical protein
MRVAHDTGRFGTAGGGRKSMHGRGGGGIFFDGEAPMPESVLIYGKDT